jgi:hypothetical protein
VITSIPDDLEADLAYVRQLLAGEIQTYQMEKRYFLDSKHHRAKALHEEVQNRNFQADCERRLGQWKTGLIRRINLFER